VIPVPVHVPPAGVAERFVARFPEQNGPAGVMLTLVELVTVTLIVLTAVQPLAVTVTVYTPLLTAPAELIEGL
jgi:hypothetical protein